MGVKTHTGKDDFPDMRKTVKTLNNTKIQCGVLGEQAWLAAIHEYGCKIKVTPKMRAYLHSQGLHLKKTTEYVVIPERSFLRNGYDENIDGIIKKTDKLVPLVLEGKIPEQKFFKLIGELLRSAIQDYAVDLKDPANHPFTVEKKGSANPLIDSGDMVGAIDYEVVK